MGGVSHGESVLYFLFSDELLVCIKTLSLDEVVNEQFLVEEIYERELKSRKQDDEDSLLETITCSISYGTM